MNHYDLSASLAAERVDCLGEFRKEDRICRFYCALRLRCAIEREQNLRLELIEDFFDAEAMGLKVQ